MSARNCKAFAAWDESENNGIRLANRKIASLSLLETDLGLENLGRERFQFLACCGVNLNHLWIFGKRHREVFRRRSADVEGSIGAWVEFGIGDWSVGENAFGGERDGRLDDDRVRTMPKFGGKDSQ